MNDLRSFLRYLVPGTVFVVELSLLWYVANPNFLTPLEGLPNLDHEWLGAIVVLLASAGFGYLASQTHHIAYWKLAKIYGACEYRTVIMALQARGYLTFKCQQCGDLLHDYRPTPMRAWQIVTELWHGHKSSSDRLKGTTGRVESLTDLMHGSGAALMASFGAVAVLLIQSAVWCNPIQWWAVVIAIIFLIGHYVSYRTTVAHTQGVWELAFFAGMSELAKPSSNNASSNTLTCEVPCAICDDEIRRHR